MTLLFVISRVISSSTIDLYNKYMDIKVPEVGLCKTAKERILKICELRAFVCYRKSYDREIIWSR
jgi:hypothetical protein